MIVFNLSCANDHTFEAWFKDAAAYRSQRRARKVACPMCGDTGITKMPAAPRLAKGAAREGDAARAQAARGEAMRELAELHSHVENTCDYVGDRFGEEARRIHYGETEERGIYGEASNDEAKELKDEGVPFARIPKLPPKNA